MNASPEVSLAFPADLLQVLLAEVLLGLGFNSLVAWAHEHRLWHVSVSVSLGVGLTLVIPAGAWWRHEMPFWMASLLLLGCFTASGIPMIAGSTRRTVREKHERRPWPNAALRARDDVVMELSAMAADIAEKTRDGEIKVQDMADYVNRLHQMKGTLKSV